MRVFARIFAIVWKFDMRYNGVVPFTNPKTHAMGAKANHDKRTPEEKTAYALKMNAARWKDKPRKSAKQLKKAA